MTCRHNKNSLALQEWNERKQVQEGDFYVYSVSSCCLKKDTKFLDVAGSLSGNWEGFLGFLTHIYKYMVFFPNFRGALTFIYTRKKVPHHKHRWKQNKKLIKCMCSCWDGWQDVEWNAATKRSDAPLALTLCNDCAGTWKFIRLFGQWSLNVFWIYFVFINMYVECGQGSWNTSCICDASRRESLLSLRVQFQSTCQILFVLPRVTK